ncbi:MAG: hypothetical protein Q9160_005221 [Pyrenula sp. 1 TL-2023]
MPRTPRRWTPEEDQILRREAATQLEEGSVKSWNRIADQLPGRSNKDCRKRWCNEVAGGLKKGPWSRDEDQILGEAVRKYGQRWTAIAPLVGSRSADQCAKRWTHSLDPDLDRNINRTYRISSFSELSKSTREAGRRFKAFIIPAGLVMILKIGNATNYRSKQAESIPLPRTKSPCCDGQGNESGTEEQQRPRSHTGSEFSLDAYSSKSPIEEEDPLSSADMLDLHALTEVDVSFEGYLESTSFTPKSVSLTLPPISQEDMPNLSQIAMEDVNVDQFLDFSDLYGGNPYHSQSSNGMTTPWPSDSATDVASFEDVVHKMGLSPSDGMTEMDLTSDRQVMESSRPATSSEIDDKQIEATKHSQVRLVIDSPIQETSSAIIDSVLRAQAKVSMTAEADSRMTLTLMDIPTPKVNALLSILFETGTKFHMETD